MKIVVVPIGKFTAQHFSRYEIFIKILHEFFAFIVLVIHDLGQAWFVCMQTFELNVFTFMIVYLDNCTCLDVKFFS